MKVLVSAYACAPNKGSEPEVGYRTVVIAARKHDVWVLTRSNNVESLEMALANEGIADSVHVVGIDQTGLALSLKHRGLPFLHWYYDRWQRAAGQAARALDQHVGFDLAHHVTFAAYWTRTGIAGMDVPLVWGPIGGGARTPRGLRRSLGFRGRLGEALREGVRPVVASLNRAHTTARAAGVVIAQNTDTLTALGSPSGATVLPNALSVDVADTSGSKERRDIVFASRLIPLKAVTLAVDAFAQLDHREAVLHVFGEGPDRRRLVSRVAAYGLESRVRIHGHMPREKVLEGVASARVLLHPALHDEAPLAVAEALSLGTPVVALDHAGPAAVAGFWPERMSCLVAPSTVGRTAEALADAVDLFLERPPPARAPSAGPDFAEALLNIYEVAREGSGRRPPGYGV